MVLSCILRVIFERFRIQTSNLTHPCLRMLRKSHCAHVSRKPGETYRRWDQCLLCSSANMGRQSRLSGRGILTLTVMGCCTAQWESLVRVTGLLSQKACFGLMYSTVGVWGSSHGPLLTDSMLWAPVPHRGGSLGFEPWASCHRKHALGYGTTQWELGFESWTSCHTKRILCYCTAQWESRVRVMGSCHRKHALGYCTAQWEFGVRVLGCCTA